MAGLTMPEKLIARYSPGIYVFTIAYYMSLCRAELRFLYETSGVLLCGARRGLIRGGTRRSFPVGRG